MNICPSDCPNKFGGECDAAMCMPKRIEGNKKAAISSDSLTVSCDNKKSNINGTKLSEAIKS